MGRINLIRFKTACKGSGGIISLIARRLSTERRFVYTYLENEPLAKQILQESKEEVLDIAESHLLKGITEGNKEDIKWYLARIGRKRGYQERPETQVNVQNNQLEQKTIVIKVIKGVETDGIKERTNE